MRALAGTPAVRAWRHPVRVSRVAGIGVAGRPAPAPVEEGYERCRRLHAAHGRTFYLATRLLPADRRRHVHALYGFARYADELVDRVDPGWPPGRRAEVFRAWSAAACDAVTGGGGTDPLLCAVARTVAELGIRHDDVRAFLASMALDLTVTRYATYEDLDGYMYGSAAVIGTMMLPVLGVSDAERDGPARGAAMDLGTAFQLTNFLRDVGEDFRRGRIYLPLEDLDRFGVTERHFAGGDVTPPLRRLLQFEAARTRALYRRAEAGWALLPPGSQACIRVAHRLYGGILDAIERSGYQVLRTRARVPARRRLAVVARELVLPSPPGAAWLP